MRILLVQPALELDRRYGRHPLQTMFRPAPITLPTVAAHTPEQHDVTIVDDAFMDVPYDADVDLVGITGSTPFAVRMEEIARGFAARGRIVAAGGVYPTLCPEAAGEFARRDRCRRLRVGTGLLLGASHKRRDLHRRGGSGTAREQCRLRRRARRDAQAAGLRRPRQRVIRHLGRGQLCVAGWLH